jgi:hypothetical protein
MGVGRRESESQEVKRMDFNWILDWLSCLRSFILLVSLERFDLHTFLGNFETSTGGADESLARDVVAERVLGGQIIFRGLVGWIGEDDGRFCLIGCNR